MTNLDASGLMLHSDRSVFHLRLHPHEVAETIILVGDPERVDRIAMHLDKCELRKQNREFRTVTGQFKGKRLSIISTGIGTDNIDIVLNELDALVNIDIESRIQKEPVKKLNFFRIGTTGGLQEDVPINSFILTRMACGFDGVLNFYKDRDNICIKEAENQFISFTDWPETWPAPYFVNASAELFHKLNENVFPGITISSPGFYGPQIRSLRLQTRDPSLLLKLNKFRYEGLKVMNFEMESSALYGLAGLMGHNAVTICAMIANRLTGEFNADYKPVIDNLISFTLDRIL